MDVCQHCHNVLPSTIDRCTVCGTAKVDPNAGDTRRRDGADAPSHAPGWAQAPNEINGSATSDDGLHVDEFLQELTGEPGRRSAPGSPLPAPDHRTSAPATPPTGALAGYLGTTVDRSGSAATAPNASEDLHVPFTQDAPPPTAPTTQGTPSSAGDHPSHLSTAANVAADGVAARTTRLDGTVALGPTDRHQVLTLGVPLAAAALLIAGVVGTYRIGSSEAEAQERAAEVEAQIDTAAIAQIQSAVVLLDLDGCGVVDQTTGILFADQTVLVPRSATLTDHRPTIVTDNGERHTASVLGWSMTRDLAVVRPDESRLAGGLRWGVSSRVRVGDSVSLVAITGPGVASPVPATIEATNTVNGQNVSFELSDTASAGSVVLDASGFVIGVVGDDGRAQASDDLAPAVSRIVLDNERPQAVCPPPPTTVPPTTESTDAGNGDEGDAAETE